MTRALFEIIHQCNEVEFKRLLRGNDPNAKMENVPLLHYVVRNAGPAHLQLLIDAGVDVNAVTDQDRPASALQWLTGRIRLHNNFFGFQQNYQSQQAHRYERYGHDGFRKLDGFIGTANEIMQQIATFLCNNGAKKDFYSACALGDVELVFQYLSQQPSYLTEPGPDGASALAWAARRGQDQVVRLLLEQGANLEQENIYSHYTPLEETLTHDDNLTTVKLLIDSGAVLGPNIIGICGNKFQNIDYLLSISKSPSQLVTQEAMLSIKKFTYYKTVLKLFYKHQVSLAETDLAFSLQGSPLIFDGCIERNNALRWLIAMGCNINAIFSPPEMNHRKNPLVGTKPMVFLAIYFSRIPQAEKKRVLWKMAILFFYGSDIEPSNANQPHPINDLPDQALIQFLVFLYDEIKMHGANAIIKQSDATLAMLLDKIRVISVQIKDDESTLAKLTSLGFYLEPPSLQKTATQYIVKHGLFTNLQHLPADLQYRIELLNRTKF